MNHETTIARYLETGEYETALLLDFLNPGGMTTAMLNEALSREVQKREQRVDLSGIRPMGNWKSLARSKATPLVQGLFPRSEQQAVLTMFDQAVVFLTPDSIHQILLSCRWPGTAWRLANMYLDSIGAECLSRKGRQAVGLSEETSCYVSLHYFEEEDPFADYVVHEMAHTFHNCKRKTVGLIQTRRKEWLLNIDFHKRELFAFACEVYSRILEMGPRFASRRMLFRSFVEKMKIPISVDDKDELLSILNEAVSARNGWKRILQRCSPPLKPKRGSPHQRCHDEQGVHTDENHGRSSL